MDWDEREYDGVDEIYVTSSKLWIPLISFFDRFDHLFLEIRGYSLITKNSVRWTWPDPKNELNSLISDIL